MWYRVERTHHNLRNVFTATEKSTSKLSSFFCNGVEERRIIQPSTTHNIVQFWLPDPHLLHNKIHSLKSEEKKSVWSDTWLSEGDSVIARTRGAIVRAS